MNFAELENSIIEELDDYINLWSVDGYGSALDNRIIAIKAAKRIVKEKIEAAKIRYRDELPKHEQICSTCGNSSTPCLGQIYCERRACWMPEDADCSGWCVK